VDGCCANAADDKRSQPENQIFARTAMGTSRLSIGSSLFVQILANVDLHQGDERQLNILHS
jgi:hypothetical protein